MPLINHSYFLTDTVDWLLGSSPYNGNYFMVSTYRSQFVLDYSSFLLLSRTVNYKVNIWGVGGRGRETLPLQAEKLQALEGR